MQIERTKNAARNIVWGTIEKIMILLLPFATRTVMIKTLGAEYLGLSSLFTSILSVLSISELGFGSAIVFSMYKPIAEDDKVTLCALLNAYRKIYLAIGTIILGVGIVVIPFLPKLISGDYPADINLYVLYLIYLFNTVISYYLFAYKAALFSAYQRNDLTSKCSAVINLTSNVLKIVLLLMFHNYYIYVMVIPLTTLATNIANALLAKKYYSDIQCKGRISTELKNGIKKRMVGLISFKIYGVVFSAVDTIFISAFLGLTQLAIYNNYCYIQNSIVGFMTILTTSITAGVGNKMVTNSVEDNYIDFKNFTFANGWLCSWCAVCLLCLYQNFMRIWVGDELLFGFDTMALMVLYFFLPRTSTLTYTYREAAGLWWEDRYRPIVATIVNLGVNIILVKTIGINGVLISTLICTVFINIPWGSMVLFKKYFKKSTREYFLLLVFYISVTAVVAMLTYGICMMVPFDGYLGLIIRGIVCCIVPNILFYGFYHKMKEFGYTKLLIRKILVKFSKKV